MSIYILEVTVIVLFLLSLRIKFWRKSITFFSVIGTGTVIVIMHNSMNPECFKDTAAIFTSIALFAIFGRAIFKTPNDKLLGGLSL